MKGKEKQINMSYDSEPEYTRQIRCSECKNWKQVSEETSYWMDQYDIPDSEYVCDLCRKQESLIP